MCGYPKCLEHVGHDAELGSISENNGTYKSVRLLEVSRCESYGATYANRLKYDMSG